MSENIAIKIQGLKKKYRLGQIGGGTLTADLQSWWAKIRKKEDPNTKIGQDVRLNGNTFMALNGIDLTIYEGEAIGIIGGNGAGKSTLLKILSRITAPTDGTVDIYGRIASMLEVGTGFSPEMTGRENIYMNGAILGMSKAEIDEKMEDIIEFSEIRDFIDTPVKRYSSGMYVKLAFSVAAHLNSEIMIMDEVLAVGDMAFQQKCLDKMRDAAKKEGRTVLYVSHNMNTIRQLCDRCVVLDGGKIVFEGDVEDGIGIYMGINNSIDTLNVDLSNRRMKYLSPNVKAKMTRLQVLDKESAAYKSGEDLHFNLTVRANQVIEKLSFRLELRFQDDSPIGTAFCDTSTEFKAGDEKTLTFRFPTTGLTRGRYKCLFVIYGMNQYGAWEDYDAIWPVCCFQLDDELKINWNQRWGHVKLSDVCLEQIK